MLKKVTIHTDGGCHGNPGPGGWAALLQHAGRQKELSGAEPATTNNRMELMGAIQALRALRQPCEVAFHLDSQYVRQGVTEWMANWKRRGWQTLAKKPVKNADLWRALDATAAPHRITWHWLKGHAGHVENERCDQLATAAITALRARLTPAQMKEALAAFRAEQGTDPTALL